MRKRTLGRKLDQLIAAASGTDHLPRCWHYDAECETATDAAARAAQFGVTTGILVVPAYRSEAAWRAAAERWLNGGANDDG